MKSIHLKKWTGLSSERRNEIVEHLRCEAEQLADEGDGELAGDFLAAASVLSDVVHLPELAER